MYYCIICCINVSHYKIKIGFLLKNFNHYDMAAECLLLILECNKFSVIKYNFHVCYVIPTHSKKPE